MKHREPAAFAIPRFSVTKPVTVLMILLTILVVGYIAYQRIAIAMYPEGMEGNMLYIFADYRNASPRDVEEKITRKIEDIIGTVPNVQRVTSYSGSGRCYVRVYFQTGTKLRDAYAMLSDRMDRVKPLLPDDVDRIWVRRWDQNDEPMMNLIAIVPPEIDDAAYRLENFVKPALQRIEGVGNVDIWGIQSRTVHVDLNDELLRSHRIEVSTMLANLRNQNFALSGGYVMEAGRKIYVRSLGRFTSVQEIGELIVDPQRRLRLKDVATVTFRMPRREWAYRVDGKPAIGVQLTRDSTGNMERISREVRATLKTLPEMPQLAGMKFEVFSDQGATVRAAIDNLLDSGKWGGIFAALVIFVFLRAPRMTAILTLSIPLSLLCTIVALYFMDWSLNMATMMGLLLAVGMVVDNAIVIVENIYRRRQEGLEATQASILGAGEVGLAVVMSTFTSIVVFLPLMLMSRAGEIAFWLKRIGVPVIISLLASLFIALVFVPLAAQRLSRGAQHPDLRFIAWLRERYAGALKWVLRRPLDAVIVVAAAMLTLPFARDNLQRPAPGSMSSSSSGTSMWFYFDLPSGGTIEAAEVFFTKIEKILDENRERYNLERYETRFSYNNGRVQLKLRPDPNTQWYEQAWDSFRRTDTVKWIASTLGLPPPPTAMDRDDIETDFRQRFLLPAGIAMRSQQRGSSGGPMDPGMSISLYGEDTGTLMTLGEETVRRLRTIPGLLSVDIDLERGGQELRIQLDRDRARRMGVNPQAVSSNISNAVRGMEVGRYNAADGRELRVWAQLSEVDRQRIDDVKTMTFRTDTGMEVPLESLADLSVARTLGQIQRENRQTILRIVARAPRADARKLFEAVDQSMAGFEFPRGYRWDKGSYFSTMAENEKAMSFAVALAIIFVFLLMGMLFESVVLPLAVIIAVPFSFLGVYWTLYLTKTPFDRMAMIGAVILIGVVVNNAIVLVDMANRLRAEGKERFDALVEAGRARFRPIMMTTLTTVFGLMPMAVGNSKMIGMPYAPLGRTMIGGLLASTLLTLLVVPLFYILLDDLREHAMRMFQSVWTRPPAGPAPEGATNGAAAGRRSRDARGVIPRSNPARCSQPDAPLDSSAALRMTV
ncbi:MAG: efflux RND transporter permease subunit [Opitutaceae bacterium]|nr:efflux RND transporter permease subunit [Opitutaceae bacterium]